MTALFQLFFMWSLYSVEMAEYYTTNHEEIEQWMRAHDAQPARIRGTTEASYADPQAIEIVFSAARDDLEQVSFPELFAWIEAHNLALRYTDQMDEGFAQFEFIDRDTFEQPDSGMPDSGDPDVQRDNLIPDNE